MAEPTEQHELFASSSPWKTDVVNLLRNNESTDTEEIIRKQIQTIESLPDNFIIQLVAHLKATYIEQSSYENFNPNHFNDRNVLKGEIFERLLEAEDSIFHLDPNWEKYPQTPEQRLLSEKLLSVMANPDRFNIDKWPIRNPDLVSIIFENGSFYIRASIEAKTHLDARSLVQLKSFKENLIKVTSFLNNMPDSEKHGLPEFGQNKQMLYVSNDYFQILAIPRGTQLEDKEDQQTGFVSNNMFPHQREEILKIINDPNLIKTIYSSFNHEELNCLTNFFFDKVQQVITKEKSQR